MKGEPRMVALTRASLQLTHVGKCHYLKWHRLKEG
jgi:hypothetical protein